MADRFNYFDADILDGWQERVKRDAVNALKDSAVEGEEVVRETIRAKTTDWGDARVAGLVHGPRGTSTPREHAGRIEGGQGSEDMIGSVDSDVTEVGHDVWEARIGWSDPAEYFMVQEWGFKEFDTNIEPMEALHRALDHAEGEFTDRLRNIARGRA